MDSLRIFGLSSTTMTDNRWLIHNFLNLSRYGSLISLLLLTCCLYSSYAQIRPNLNPKKHLSQYVLRAWSTEDGLNSESSNELVQSDDGYIWIATYNGLHRFDGKDYTIFDSNSGLPSPNVSRLEKGKDGKLWIGSLHGVAYYFDGQFHHPENLSPLMEKSIEDMLLSENDELWVSTKSNELFHYANDQLYDLTDSLGLNQSTVLSIEEDTEGNIYFGTDDSQFIKYSKDGSIDQIELGREINGILTLFADDSVIYIGTGRGLYIWDQDKIRKHTILEGTSISSIILDETDILWVGTLRGLFRYQESTSTLDSLTEDNGMPNNIVRDMAFDRDGNLWIGTYRNGIFFLSDGSMTSYTKNDGLATNIISSVTELEKGTYLLGNENGQLNIFSNGLVSDYNPPIPLPSERLKNLFTDKWGRVWASTYGGLFVLDGANSRKYAINNGFPDNFIRVVFQDNEDKIWVGTKNAGLFRFNSLDDWDQITIKDGLSSNYILSIEQNLKGEIIVGTISGLNILKDLEVIKTVKVDDGLPSNFMFATHSTNDFIWIASNDGLTGYNNEKIVNFNTENGLPSNIIYDVLPGPKGNLWLPSENSIISVNLEELETAAHEGSTIRVRQYDKSYGIKNSHCLGAVLSFIDSKNQFWIPTLEGILRINPREIEPPTIGPSLIIENITADNEVLKPEDLMYAPSSTDRLIVDFTGINFIQAEALQFRYKLSPFDEDWVESNGERNALYTNLSPGQYQFELQAGIDDTYFDTTINQKITIQAAWWQTIWAKAALVIFIIIVALLIYYIRLRALTSNNLKLESTVKQRTEQLERQKSELKHAIEQLKSAQQQMIESDKMASLGILAAGVAHEINNPLNFIQGGVDGLEQNLKRNENVELEDYSTLLTAIKEGISRAATIVSSLNEFNHSSEDQYEICNMHHMINNCLTMIQYQVKNGIEIIKDFSKEDLLVMGNNGKIHQALLNIITNAVQAIDDKGEIKIKTLVDKKNAIIEFTDSGQGIKEENLHKIMEPFFSTKDPGKGTGLGLSITYSIIHEHNGSLKFSSVWGKGTTARVVLPMADDA